MQWLYIATTVLFTIWTVRNVLSWLYLWQIKEYRIDRLLVHFKETNQGKKIFFNFSLLLKLILTIVFFIGLILYWNLTLFYILVFLTFLYPIYNIFEEVRNRTIRLPRPTTKISILLAISVLIYVILLLFPLLDKYFWFLIIDRIMPIVIACGVFLLSIPSEMYKDYIISKAASKIKKYSKLKTIGITGSYGKGVTKEYITHILSQKYKVVNTFGSHNTPIGIASTILNKLTKTTDYFVVEMGAYRIGEIAEICSIIKPTMGIITAVNLQHVSLFGSVDKTKKAKYELIENVHNLGLCMFNGNNVHTKSLYKSSTKKNKKLYTVAYEPGKIYSSDILAYIKKIEKTKIDFDVLIRDKNKTFSFTAPLIGRQSIENLLPAIYIAFCEKMSIRDIRIALKSIKQPLRTMNLLVTKNGGSLLDDTFNINPASVEAACEYAKLYTGKKIIVLSPIIELGKNGHKVHFELGRSIGKVFDVLIITNNNYFNELKKGISDSRGECSISVLGSNKVFDLLKTIEFQKNDLIVFEGRESYKSLLDLKKYV